MAAWRGYISHPLGFAFAAPGDLKVEKGTYRGALAGQRDTLVYRFLDDNIEYKAVIIDMFDIANNSANLLGEAEYQFQENKKLLMDTFGRVDRQLGRKLTTDLPGNGGRSTGAFYFINGRVVSLQGYKRPIFCTEYMARPRGSTFEAILPIAQKYKVAAYNWGFVACKSQTIYPWDSWQKAYTAEPSVWFHDVFRPDGSPYRATETTFIRKITGKSALP